MHCTPKYQKQLAKLAIEHFGDNLISYGEVCATQRAALLSPFDLIRRILLKGKVKGSKEVSLTRGNSAGRSTFARSTTAVIQQILLSRQSSEAGTGQRLSWLASRRFPSFSSRCASSEKLRAHSCEARTGSAADAELHTRTSNEIRTTPGVPAPNSELPLLQGREAGEAPSGATSSPSWSRLETRTSAEDLLSTTGSMEVLPTSLRHPARSTISSEVEAEAARIKAQQRLEQRVGSRNSSKKLTDELYAGLLSVRSAPMASFLKDAPSRARVYMTSLDENGLLKRIGVTRADRDRIEGLQSGISNSSVVAQGRRSFTGLQVANEAVARVARDPPTQVGVMQWRTTEKLLRIYPLGLRFSGSNMSPLPGWLSGGQSVCLNLATTKSLDLATQVHVALFTRSEGYVLKPPEMLHESSEAHSAEQQVYDPDAFWPPPRETLHCTTIDVLSLHNLPKRGECRPDLSEAFHTYLGKELSGLPRPPNDANPSSPAIWLELHPIGGAQFILGCAARTFVMFAQRLR